MNSTTETLIVKNILVKKNYREQFKPEELEELSASIKQNGLLQSIGVNRTANGDELIFGERRLRAHELLNEQTGDFAEISAKVYINLTDAEVKQLQLVENIQRADVHAMDEARAFKDLVQAGKSILDIALLIGKSATYVAQRLKLNDLYIEFQEAFKRNLMTLRTAIDLCRISEKGQEDLWIRNYADEEEIGFIEISERDVLTYLNNLNKAPFDIADAQLTSVGACTGCPFNSACNTVLFPELADQATCTKPECFQEKAEAGYVRELKTAIDNPLVELVSRAHGEFSEETMQLVNDGHKVLDFNSFYPVERPEKPDMEEFTRGLERGDFDDEAEMQESYSEDLAEFERDFVEFETEIASGKIVLAFVVEGREKGRYIHIRLGNGKNEGKTKKQSAKDLQEKVNAGTYTDKDVQAEIDRLKGKAQRSKELDEEKVQPLFYQLLEKNKMFAAKNDALHKSEKIAMLLMWQEYAGYHLSEELYKLAGVKKGYSGYGDVQLFKAYSKMDDERLDLIINQTVRLAVLGKFNLGKGCRPETSGKAAALKSICCVYDQAGVDEIWNAQMQVRSKREGRLAPRLKELNGMLRKKEPQKKVKKKKKKK